MNVTVDHDGKVDRKANHPALLDTKNYDEIVVLPRNQHILKTTPNTVRGSVLGNGLKEVRW